METPVAALLLIAASVVFACIVIGFAVNLVQASLNGQMTENMTTELQHLDNSTQNWLNWGNSILDSAPEPTPTLQPSP